MGKWRKWKGISAAGIESMEGIVNREMLSWSALYPYQLIVVLLSFELLSDCLHISFQSGAEFHTSSTISNFPCQESPMRMPEFELRAYQSI